MTLSWGANAVAIEIEGQVMSYNKDSKFQAIYTTWASMRSFPTVFKVVKKTIMTEITVDEFVLDVS